MIFPRSFHIHKFWTLIVLTAAALVALPTTALAEGRWALILAVSQYEEDGIDDLANAANDGRTMAAALNRMGFEIYYAEDASKEEFDATVDRILAEQSDSTLGMFYFAGHGLQSEGVNFALPSTISVNDVGRLSQAAISVNETVSRLATTGVENLVVILDACREPPFQDAEVSGTGLALVNAPENTIIAYSTAPGEVAFDGTGQNSPYTAALANALLGGETDMRDALRLVRAQVRLATGGMQTPWFIDNSRGEMIIGPTAAPDRTDQMEKLQEGEISLSATAWWTIADSMDRRDFETYLALFPNSEYNSAARRQMSQVETPDFPLMEIAGPETNPIVPGGLDSLITQCDILASGGRGYMALVEAVPKHLINIRFATRACIEATRNDPDNPRLLGLLAGVLFADERYAEARHYALLALENGNASANALLGRMYRFGLGVDRDLERAAELALEGVLGGVARLRTVMGVNYREGRGVPQSYNEARRWFELAVYDGHVAAMSALGDMYRRGNLGQPDPVKAFEYYSMAAALGQSDALSNVGMAYMRGDGVREDVPLGLSYLGRASDIGNPYAAYHLGRAFRTGWGVEKNPDQAIAYFRLAAQRNFLGAYIKLGEMYEEGPADRWPDALANYVIAREAGLVRDTKRSRDTAASADERAEALKARMTEADKVAGEKIAQDWIDQYGLLDFTRVNN